MISGDQVIFAGAMLQKTDVGCTFSDDSYDEADDLYYELSLVSFVALLTKI